MKDEGESVEFEQVRTYRVKLNSDTGSCWHIKTSEAVTNEEIAECKTSDSHQGLRLTFESVNKELHDKSVQLKAKNDHQAALNILLDQFGLVDAHRL